MNVSAQKQDLQNRRKGLKVAAAANVPGTNLKHAAATTD
jgi:hypothetical protein